MEEVGSLEHSILLSELEWLEKDINKTLEAVGAVLGRGTLHHHQDGLDLISSFTQKLKGVESLIPRVRGVLSMRIPSYNNGEVEVGGEDGDMINEQDGLSLSSYHHEGEVEGTVGTRGRGVNCPVCHKQLAHRWSLEGHVKRVHQGPRPHQCEICNKTFAHPQELIQHIEKHKEIRNFQRLKRISKGSGVVGGGVSCPKCDKWFPNMWKLRRHLESKFHSVPGEGHNNSNKRFYCGICTNRGFRDKSDFRKHRQKVHMEQWFRCLKCRKWFENEDILKEHEERYHSPRNFQCAICSKTFNRLDHLNRHILIHKKWGRVRVDDVQNTEEDSCSKDKSAAPEEGEYKYENIFQLEGINSAAVSQSEYETPIFPSSSSSVSFSSPAITNTLKLNECNKGPVLIPVQQRRTKCLKCGKQYSTRYNLERHERKVHRYAQKKRPQRCGHCNRTFTQDHLLIAHMRSHVHFKQRPSKRLTINRNGTIKKKQHPSRPQLLGSHSNPGFGFPVNLSERRGSPTLLGWKFRGVFQDVGRAKGYLKEMFYKQVSSNLSSQGKKIYYYCMKGKCPKKAFLHVPDITGEVRMYFTPNEHNHQYEEISEENDDPTLHIIDHYQLPHYPGEEHNEDDLPNTSDESDREYATGCMNLFFAMSSATTTTSSDLEDDEDVEDIALLGM